MEQLDPYSAGGYRMNRISGFCSKINYSLQIMKKMMIDLFVVKIYAFMDKIVSDLVLLRNDLFVVGQYTDEL
jgi:hypothetical protein